jgi:hypothetical protein
MKNPTVTSAKYCLRRLTVLSAMGLLAFSGCASIDDAAQNHGVRKDLQTSRSVHGQEKQSNQADNPEPDYEWWY